MRPTRPLQRPLFSPPVEHPLAEELAEIDAVLELYPEWSEWVQADLTKRQGVKSGLSRRSLSGKEVLRLHVLKHRLNVSVRRLASLVADSLALREFLGLGLEEGAPKRSTIQNNLVKVQPETWGRISGAFLRSSEAQAFDAGEKIRADATPVETNTSIRPPTPRCSGTASAS